METKKLVDDIEYKISYFELTNAQVFTKMKCISQSLEAELETSKRDCIKGRCLECIHSYPSNNIKPIEIIYCDNYSDDKENDRSKKLDGYCDEFKPR